MASLTRFSPHYAIARAIAQGLSLDYAKVDTMFADIASAIEAIVTRLNGVTNVSGTLRNLAEATAQALAGSAVFTATAAQTAFTTTITYSASFTSANVAVYHDGIRFAPAAVTVANSAGFLRVTLAAQTAGTVIVVDAFESGAGILTTLMSVASGDGASLIGVQDLGALFTATTVEGCLAEARTALNALVTTLGVLANICYSTGFTMSGDIDIDGNELSGLAAGVNPTDAVRMDQIDAASLLAVILPALAGEVLALSGGTMSGTLDMGNNLITNLAPAVDAGGATNKAQLDASVAASRLLTVRTVTGSALIVGTDDVIEANATTASFTLTLPSAAANPGKVFHVKKIDVTANTVTIDGDTTDTIDGALTLVLRAQWQSTRFVSDGVGWFILQGYDPTAVARIRQTKQTVDSARSTVTGTAYADAGTLTATLPDPLLNVTSKVRIRAAIQVGNAAGTVVLARILRGATDLTPSGCDGMGSWYAQDVGAVDFGKIVIEFDDTPGAVAPAAYKVQLKQSAANTIDLNGLNASSAYDTMSTITLEEIVA